MRLHLDTDIGGDMDDLCALAMLLKWPGAEFTGLTTVAEEQGRRAGYAAYALAQAGRADIPVAAGADLAEGYFRFSALDYPPDELFWHGQIPPRPGPLAAALGLLKQSVEQGAMLVGIGPFTNLMLLDQQHPGILRQAEIVLMGGYVFDVPAGYPPFPRRDDWNIQLDITAARYVLEHAAPLLVPLTVSCQTALRRAHLPGLRHAGGLSALIARQAEAFADLEHLDRRYGSSSPRLPADIINFLHDPLACAIAMGWRDGIRIEKVPIRLEVSDGYLMQVPDSQGVPTRLVTEVDGEAFSEWWHLLLSS